MSINLKRIILVLVIILVNIGLDQWTKQIAVKQLKHHTEMNYLNGMFKFTYAENSGAFLSLGANSSERVRNFALKALPMVLLIGLFFYVLFSHSLNRWQIIAFSFVLGGGISNIYDRMLYHKVVDFMNIGIGDLRSGIFNVADMSIMAGLFLLIPFMFKSNKQQPSEEPTQEEV
ncbi:MAG: lipoprotein signal peptidase [Saprospiraceae bacterium]|nr:MAG: lipoprotein signal peptidase [Saprospiraceae bacterium]